MGEAQNRPFQNSRGQSVPRPCYLRQRLISYISAVLCVAILVGSFLSPLGAAYAAPTQATQCDVETMTQFLYRGDWNGALYHARGCVAYFKAEVEYADTHPSDPARSSFRLLDVLQVSHFLCATAQILTIMGSLKQASKSADEAMSWANNHPESFGTNPEDDSTHPLFQWAHIIHSTRGFIQEKAGGLQAAAREYQRDDFSFGRAAVLALRAGNNNQALQLATRDANSNPTANAVLAALSEQKGDRRAALTYYRHADTLMREAYQQHDWWPINFAERDSIVRGLQRLSQ